MKKSIMSLVLVVSMLISSCLMSGVVTANADDTNDTDMTKEEYIASLRSKSVMIDYNVIVNTDEWGLWDGNDYDVLKNIRFGIFTAENVALDDGDDVLEANTLVREDCVSNSPTNPTGKTKKVFLDEFELPKGKYYIKQMAESELFDCNEHRCYFTVGNDTQNVEEYIDLSQDLPTINLRYKEVVFTAKVYESDTPYVEGAKLVIRSLRQADKPVVYQGYSDSEGVFAELPSLPFGHYEFTLTTPDGYILSNNESVFRDEFFVDRSNFYTTTPTSIELVCEKKTVDTDTNTDAFNDTDSSSDTDKTKEEYIASLRDKKVDIDYNVIVTTDKWGLYNGNDEAVLDDIHFGIFTAEAIVLDDDETWEANKLVGDGSVSNMPSNPTGDTKKVSFSNGTSNGYDKELILPKGKYYIKQTDESKLFACDEHRCYFTVGNDTQHEEEYIDLSQDMPIVVLKQKDVYFSFSSNNEKSEGEIARHVEGVKIVIRANSTSNTDLVVYQGVTNSEGIFEDIPTFPVRRYIYTITCPDGYSFTEGDTRKEQWGDFDIVDDSFQSTQPLYFGKGCYKIDNMDDNDTSKTAREIELEQRVAELEAQLSVYGNRLLGDVDGDNKITAKDSLLILRHTLHLYTIDQ